MGRSALASLDMIRRLVAFPTVSRDSNLALIEHVRDYLDGLGVGSHLIYDDDRRKANLYATLGPPDKAGICLSGHTDVVPVDGQEWDTDPFTATLRDGRLYGRGTCDMKGFLGAVLALAPEFLERGLNTPLHLALSYDEEVGCLGVPRLIDGLAVKPAACIVGEPTGMKPVVGHKGKLSVACHVHGLECHSSMAPDGGVNAVEYAAQLIVHLRAMAERRRTRGPFDPEFDPPHTTIHTGTICGGTALNIVPADCVFHFEFRTLPCDDAEALLAEARAYAETELLPQMRAVGPDTGFGFSRIAAFPGLDTPKDHPVVDLVKALTGANAVGKVSFGTEAGLFSAADIPAVVCGPGFIDQAHKPNEFITLDQIAACEAFLRRLMDRVCAA